MNKEKFLLAFCVIIFIGLLSGCARSNNSASQREVMQKQTNSPDAKKGSKPTNRDGKSQTTQTTLSPVPPEIIEHGSRSSKQIALTFDLCEAEHDHAGFDEKIINILTQKGAKATFFMGGKWAETHPDAGRALAKNNLFDIENHTYSHKVFTGISDQEARQQILKAQASIKQITGKTPKYFRFPAGKYSQQDLKILGDCGLKAIQWDVVTGDPDPHISATDIIRVVKQKARGGSIIIMHANGRGRHSAEALPQIIDYLQGKGYKLVTITELLKS